MPQIEWELEGDDELAKFFQQSPKEASQLLAKAMYEEATEAFGQSQDLVPVRYGVLRASGTVTGPKQVGNNVSETEIFYGGAAAPYAAYVHEIERYRHDSPTRSKYLSFPLEKRFPVLGNRLKVRLEDMIRKLLEIV